MSKKWCVDYLSDQTSVWSPSEETEPESEDRSLVTSLHIYRAEKTQKHVFLSKTVKSLRCTMNIDLTEPPTLTCCCNSPSCLQVIRPETCSPCGKRIRFGKMAVKCSNCRLVAHPECKQKFSDGCSATAAGASAPMVCQFYISTTLGWTLTDFSHIQTRCTGERAGTFTVTVSQIIWLNL